MAMTLIATNPDSTDVATVEFTSGLDTTYKLYVFKFIDLNAATDATDFTFQGSIDGGSNYNVTMTTTAVRQRHQEDGESGQYGYETSQDLAQATTFKILLAGMNSDADGAAAGTLWLYNPSNTTFAKNWYSRVTAMSDEPASREYLNAGMFNDANNIDAVQFKMASGNFDGTIKLYGVS